MHELIVIGGGASGIAAAITAKDLGIDVAIIEGNSRIAKKVLTTGNGRCNITNECTDYSRYHSENPNFFLPVLNSFNVEETINFFNQIGLPLVTLEDGKMYPMSLQASSVVDILRASLEEKGIPVYLDTKVNEVKKDKNGFTILSNSPEKYYCNKLILACGGKAAPNTGSDGSGYSLAKKLGHSIVTPLPALVQLKLNYPKLRALSGVKFEGSCDILIDGKTARKEYGEILFTDYGISGPPILQLSRLASSGLSEGSKVTIKVDMVNNMPFQELKIFLENHWGTFGYRSISDSLIGIINKKLIPVILKEASIDNIHKSCWELTWNEKDAIYSLLKEWEFTVIDTNGFANSQVTAGGVNSLEIDPISLQSKLIPNLYFTGEIIDVDGDCGGFNLQWAWSSGAAAGRHAAKNRLA